MSNTTNTNWEYAQVKYQIQDRGDDPTRSGQKMIWGQFLAVVDGDSPRITARSERFPFANMTGAPSMSPDKSNVGHTNMFNIFKQSLLDDGWELLKESSNSWWEIRLRRPINDAEKQSLFERVMTAVGK